MNMMDAIRRGLDRAGFEADKLMRYNRVKAEAVRLNEQISQQTVAIGERALELHATGAFSDSKIVELANKVEELRRLVKSKEQEATTIQAEAWPEPEGAAPTPTTTTPSSAPVASLPAPQPQPVAASTICPVCGASLRAGALFCSTCGSKV